MNDLIEAVKTASSVLQGVEGELKIILGNAKWNVPTCIVDDWILVAKVSEVLDRSIMGLGLRERAQAAMMNLDSNLNGHEKDPVSEFEVKWAESFMPIEVARVLSITSYIAQTWTIYDVLANAIGKIIGNREVAKNGECKNNVKLYEHFLGKNNAKCTDGFSVNSYVFRIYGVCICASYEIRNDVLHNACIIKMEDETLGEELLQCKTAGGAFDIVPSVADKLNLLVDGRVAESRGKLCGCNVELPFSFEAKDIRPQIISLHDEIDKALIELLTWGVESFRFQVRTFCDRWRVHK